MNTASVDKRNVKRDERHDVSTNIEGKEKEDEEIQVGNRKIGKGRKNKSPGGEG